MQAMDKLLEQELKALDAKGKELAVLQKKLQARLSEVQAALLETRGAYQQLLKMQEQHRGGRQEDEVTQTEYIRPARR